MTTEEKLKTIVEVADEMKAEDIETIEVGSRSSIADYFVICTAGNDRQLISIADKVAETLKQHKERPLRTEGGVGGWILQDYGDIVLHVMREEQRQFYDLETLWKATQSIDNNESSEE
jgi:ribosome-associated protein